jgi:von Willebrand factor type A domain
MRPWLLPAVLFSGCVTLQPELVDASVQKPSNIALYFMVDTSNGEPVPGLTAEQFHLYEDGKLVSPFESKQTILNPEVAATHVLLLLVDMSGSVTQSGAVPTLEAAASRFTDQVAHAQQTAVYAFDGRAEIVPVRGFSAASAEASVVGLSSFKSKDPSTNLNGAVVAALKVLQKQLDRATTPLRFGTLVVFTDGTDHAGRVTHDELMTALDIARVDVFVIGVGAEIDDHELRAIGRSGVSLTRDPGGVSTAFEQMAARIDGYTKRYYLLSYCSPARAGDHELTVEPFLPNGQSGRLTYRFNATGFGPACDPNRPPAFDLHRSKPKHGLEAERGQ